MTVYIPRFRRSNGGCMTCKRRRKKCDETKPVCTRCVNGDFTCLGYNQPGPVDGLGLNMNPGSIGSESETVLRPRASIGDPYLELLDDMGRSPAHASLARGVMQYGSTWRTTRCFTGAPKSIQLDLYTLNHVIPFVVTQYGKLYRHMLFRPGYPRIEEGIRWRAIWSDVTRWAMFLGAQVIQDLSGGQDGQRHVGWIVRFHRRILESTASTELELSDLDARLAGLHDLIMLMFMVSNTIEGYRLFKESTSVFLQLVNQIPEVWSNHSSILISASIGCRHFEVGKFVLHDTLAALALDLPPLINYDTTSYWVEQDHNPYLEWLYGVPAGIVVLIAKVNAWRVSRTMGESVSTQEEWREVEGLLLRWTPTIGRTDESFDSVVRLAVQECWRQATLIYLYMVMCKVDSTDPYVESAVRQIVKIASTIEQGNPLEPHLFIPCLVAGIAARRESHRATLRGKVLACRNEGILVLRGADFVGVLDHLWHGVAAGGKTCMWDDYMRSRCAVLPIGV